MRYLDRMQPLGLLVMRLALGVVMTAHGYHKMGGHMYEFAGYVASLGIPGWLGYVSVLTELIGGMLLIVGLFTRAAAFAVTIDMVVAILKVHLKHGLLGQGGYEFPLALAALAFSLIFFGAGPIAIDAILRAGGGGNRASGRRKPA